jgi:hypothetical protein
MITFDLTIKIIRLFLEKFEKIKNRLEEFFSGKIA